MSKTLKLWIKRQKLKFHFYSCLSVTERPSLWRRILSACNNNSVISSCSAIVPVTFLSERWNKKEFPIQRSIISTAALTAYLWCCAATGKLEGRWPASEAAQTAGRSLELNNSWLTELSWPWTLLPQRSPNPPVLSCSKLSAAQSGQRGEVRMDKGKLVQTSTLVHFIFSLSLEPSLFTQVQVLS